MTVILVIIECAQLSMKIQSLLADRLYNRTKNLARFTNRTYRSISVVWWARGDCVRILSLRKLETYDQFLRLVLRKSPAAKILKDFKNFKKSPLQLN